MAKDTTKIVAGAQGDNPFDASENKTEVSKVPDAKVEGPKEEPAAPGVTKVNITDDRGKDLGFTIDLGPATGEGDNHASLAKRVLAWSDFQVDGLNYRWSEHNALALLNRFPYIADQLRGRKFGE